MNVAEIRQRRSELEKHIAGELKRFAALTGVEVMGVEVIRNATMSGQSEVAAVLIEAEIGRVEVRRG
jgi:hypothetical protein